MKKDIKKLLAVLFFMVASVVCVVSIVGIFLHTNSFPYTYAITAIVIIAYGIVIVFMDAER